MTGKPIPPEKAQELLKGMGGDWLYGEGLGDTAINLGTAVVFPPYALVLLGNGVLSLSGYEPIHFSDALPEEQSQVWKETYSELASAPGRVAAAAAGKEFRTEERIQTEMKQRLQQLQEAQVDDKAGKIK